LGSQRPQRLEPPPPWGTRAPGSPSRDVRGDTSELVQIGQLRRYHLPPGLLVLRPQRLRRHRRGADRRESHRPRPRGRRRRADL